MRAAAPAVLSRDPAPRGRRRGARRPRASRNASLTGEGAITAVDDVSFSVAAGEFVSIIGPSGCGKSTLFNIVGGLIGDYEGR